MGGIVEWGDLLTFGCFSIAIIALLVVIVRLTLEHLDDRYMPLIRDRVTHDRYLEMYSTVQGLRSDAKALHKHLGVSLESIDYVAVKKCDCKK